MVALFSAVLSRTCKDAFALKVPLTEERLACTIVGGARTVTFDVIASQKFVAYSSFLLYKYWDSTRLC